jgi:hypothetical protein
MNIYNNERPECKDKQKYKKKIFQKIIGWFNLFNNYLSHVKDNSSLGDDKSLVDDYSQSLNSSNGELNSSSKSMFLFRVNIQRGEFLKGKFALACKNYIDALFFFTRAAKKKSIVLDGLIQKKALKHIYKLSEKLTKKLEKYKMINLSCNKKMMEYEKMKNLPLNMKDLRKSNYYKNNSNIKCGKNVNDFSFREEINSIKKEIIKDISDSNIKQAKDIIILIDFNIYEQELDNSINNVDLFIDQTKTIFNYLSNNDRLGVIIYIKQYKIVCPLMCKNKIDFIIFCEDLNYYKTKFFNEVDHTEEYKSNISENDLIKEKVELSNNEISFESRIQEDSSDEYSKNNNNLNTLSGLLKSINFSKTSLKMKK